MLDILMRRSSSLKAGSDSRIVDMGDSVDASVGVAPAGRLELPPEVLKLL